MRLVQNDALAANVLASHGVASVPPYVGLVVLGDDDRMRGAVVVSHYDGTDAELSSTGAGYWSPGTVRSLFRYVFHGLGCKRVSARCVSSNRKSIEAMLALGFVMEGVKRQAHEGQDVLLFGMLAEECRPLGARRGNLQAAKSS